MLGSGKAPKAHLETGLVPQVPPNKLSLYLVLFIPSARALHKIDAQNCPMALSTVNWTSHHFSTPLTEVLEVWLGAVVMTEVLALGQA